MSKNIQISEKHMITLRNHALHSYMTWLPVTMSFPDIWLLYNLQLDDIPGADFENSLYAFDPLEKW